MGLTVAEKTHWRDRIAARLNRHIERITAAEPGRFDRLRREARARALESLGLAGFQSELDAIEAEKEVLDRRERDARRAMLARIRGVEPDDLEDRYYGRQEKEVDTAIARRQAAHEEELLAGDEPGRRVLRLRGEKERLLDTVWLAVSPAQIRELWSGVGALVGDEPTGLERRALSLPPAGGEGG